MGDGYITLYQASKVISIVFPLWPTKKENWGYLVKFVCDKISPIFYQASHLKLSS